jgi:hypothetical protein
MTAIRLWEQRRYADAAEALSAVAQRHPEQPLGELGPQLAGRAHLDDGKPPPPRASSWKIIRPTRAASAPPTACSSSARRW